MLGLIKKVILAPVEWFFYTMLNDKQRSFFANLITEEYKLKLKKIIEGKKSLERQKLQSIKYHLYNLGIEEKGISVLEDFYKTAKDSFIKRRAAWELVLWHANLNTTEGAEVALIYISDASKKEKDLNQLRRINIIKAECLERLNQLEEAKLLIKETLKVQEHPDLYLAAANLEESVKIRFHWLNKVMSHYKLEETLFPNDKETITYDDLQTIPMEKKIESGPKVSVILPAYKAEIGIRTAIDSILSQTWKNIELLVVDDCSPDNTVQVVNEYIKKDSRVKLLSTPVNSGPYVARNIALKEATGEFVTINDADDWSHPEKIEIQVKHLMNHKDVIANTSEHARLTEELKFYRRGTPGKYIFSNMSSIMFRRQPVLEKIGYWDSVRFAADGEFKRRLVNVLGKSKYVDLKTGPLSLPRQTVTSLTGSSAFGYNGFFMGARREYVESLEDYHKKADSIHYNPILQKVRPFSVPEPMWPMREEKIMGKRKFDVVIATDFRRTDSMVIKEITKKMKKPIRIGLLQMSLFDLTLVNRVSKDIRELIDGENVQMIVYGENITTKELIIIDARILEYKQKYIPEVEADRINIVVNYLPEENLQGKNQFTIYKLNLFNYFGGNGVWYPGNGMIRGYLLGDPISKENIKIADNIWSEI